MLEKHLPADENQHERQPELEVDELVDDAREEEIERAKSEHGADVRRIDDERIAGYGEDRRNRIRREDDVGRVDDEQDDKELSRGEPRPSPRHRLSRSGL